MALGSCSHWCHVTLSLRKASVMSGRRGILKQGAGTLLIGPSWRPPLSDKAGTILVILLPVFAVYLQPSFPGLPLPCSHMRVHHDLDSFLHLCSFCSGVVLFPSFIPRTAFIPCYCAPRTMICARPSHIPPGSWDGHGWFSLQLVWSGNLSELF